MVKKKKNGTTRIRLIAVELQLRKYSYGYLNRVNYSWFKVNLR